MLKTLPPILILICYLPFSALAATPNLKMVVTAAFVSEKGLDVYRDLATYISRQIDADVRVISGTTYKESNMLIDQGIIQVGFVCGLPYTQLKAQKKVKLIAMPVVAPNPTASRLGADYQNHPGKYYSYTIVHKDSPINSWQALKGKSYVYNDVHSNSGYNMPRYKLVQLGARSWSEYFSKVEASGSHEESIRMVARGLIDASSVDSLVLDFDRHLKDADALNVKVIETLFTGGAGAPPVVVSHKTPADLVKKLQDVFISMHKNKQGMQILKRALLLRFDPPDDHNYDDIRKMEEAARKAGFRDL